MPPIPPTDLPATADGGSVPRGAPGAPLTEWTPQRLHRNARQFAKFGLVGASGVIVNVAVFTVTLLVWLLASGRIQGLSDLAGSVHDLATRRDTAGIGRTAVFLANGCGFVVSVLTNYCLNRRWTFRSQQDVAGELPKFVLVSVVAYGAQLAVFWLFHTRVHVPPIPSQLIAIACVMPINFVFNKLWSFR